MIGAAAVVVKNVLPYTLMIGNPARQIGWVSKAGLTLDFDQQDIATCPESGKRYQLKNGELITL
jgi:UDP-2-acetamido-3-amino-2,3-dideoxy-glucuronate N-acetyltransferase